MREGPGHGSRLAAGATALLAIIVAALLTSGCGGGDGDDPSDEQLQSIVDGLTQNVFVGNGLTGQRQLFHLPGAALTVDAPDGARTFVSGLADVADETDVSPAQIQPVGSNTKVVTAVLVMQLVEQGRLDIDDKVVDVASRYRGDGGALDRLVSRYQARLRGVELRELLDHTSGLADCLDSPAFFRAFERRPRATYRLDQLAGYGLSLPPIFKPGAPGKWEYSNTDYMLLGMVIEAVTGNSVGQEMNRLFEQAGMDHSYYAPGVAAMGRPPISGVLIDGYQPVPPAGVKMPAVFDAFDGAPVTRGELQASEVKVVSTNPSESGPTVRVRAAGPRLSERVERHTRFPLQDVTGTYSLSIGGPAGGIVTNSEDLATFGRALFDGELVSRRTLAQMERTVPTGENSKGVRVTWGLGFGRQQIAPGVLWKGSPRFDVWMHLGDIFGWESAAYYVPEEDLVVTNTDNLFPTPIGDLGLLRDVLRLYSSS